MSKTNLSLSNQETKIAIESLSMDLMRVALGYHRRSTSMAKRFSQEALKRCQEIRSSEIKPYFVRILKKIPFILEVSDKNILAENALMYSIICKNYAKKFYKI